MIQLFEPLRVCRGCGLEAYTNKDLELFRKHKQRPHGRDTICKKCASKYMIQRQRTNDQYYLERTYGNIFDRCYKPTHARFKDYGGRGITICDEWLNNRQAFIDWAINTGWNRNLSIDRINNDGPYSPENCCWSTYQKQQLNRRDQTTFPDRGTRICYRCKVEKPLTDFHRDKSEYQGRTRLCKECRRRRYWDKKGDKK